jgi:hypothetical protein
MNFSDLPALSPDIEKLKKELAQLCEQFGIARFEPEEIVELLEDGEAVDWMVTQLQHDNAELDADKFNAVLSVIASIVAPPKKEGEEAEEAEEFPIEAEAAVELEAEAAPPIDFSQIDLSQMGPELEALTGMKLPAGVGMKQIQKIMESPQGAFLADFGLFCQEQGIDINSASDPNQLQTLNEQWMATPRAAFDGKTPAEMMQENPSLSPLKKVETYRRPEPRIGRNDPCPCGSGKKYKKCCGRGK